MTDEGENRSQLQKQYQTLLSQGKTDFNIELFTSYFREITKVLTEEDDEMIDFLAFYNYMKLPMFIAKAIYKSFVLGYDFIPISSDDFVKYLSYLYAGGIELKLRMVFKIFDIDKDDVKIKLASLNITREPKFYIFNSWLEEDIHEIKES